MVEIHVVHRLSGWANYVLWLSCGSCAIEFPVLALELLDAILGVIMPANGDCHIFTSWQWWHNESGMVFFMWREISQISTCVRKRACSLLHRVFVSSLLHRDKCTNIVSLVRCCSVIIVAPCRSLLRSAVIVVYFSCPFYFFINYEITDWQWRSLPKW